MPDPDSLVPDLPPAHHVRLEDCDLAYFTCGARSGTPLVLCHGLAASGLQFVEDAQWFADRGFFVIVPDIRGHGRSALTGPVEETDFSRARMADDMLAILGAEGLAGVHWVGNSLGGIIGLELMGRAPQRLKSFASFGTAYRLGLPGVVVTVSALLARASGTGMLARFGAPMTCRGPKGQAIVAAMLREADVEACVAVGAEVRRYDLIANALAFPKPVLMLRGDLDKQVNNALGPTLAAMQGRSNFTLIEVKDAGHCANLDQPEKVRAALLDFIAHQPSAAAAI